MVPSKPDFPFTAVSGQENFKLALTLAAINPLIGGVLVSGPRGCAKSTLSRGLAGVLPGDQPAFVTLPLGASEDRLLGTLDLQQVLSDKKVTFHPGLLSQAHGGVLYVDEVNLLPDNLVDQLLDVVASGVNRVERDGISHQHDARFLLIGTMNPDEGELRPQLHDRFGLQVVLSNQYSVEERMQIVRLREQYDQDAVAFCEAFKYKQRNLKQTLTQARQRLSSIVCPDAIRLEIATRCHEARVEGLRADIVWNQTAAAHAALRGGKSVTMNDVDQVEELVLGHRRQAPTQSPPPSPPPFRRPPDSGRGNSSDATSDNQKTDGSGQWGSLPPQFQSADKVVDVALDKSPLISAQASVSGKQAGNSPGGRHERGELCGPETDWFATLIRSQRQNPDGWPPQLVQKKARRGLGVLHLVLLDTSASTLGETLFAKAKGAVMSIARQAYLKREHIALFGFGNDQVQEWLSRVRAPKEIHSLLERIPAGGGTPLHSALTMAQAYLIALLRQQPGMATHTYILTDGRCRESVGGIQIPGQCYLIDTEASVVKRGRGPTLAQELGASYSVLEVS